MKKKDIKVVKLKGCYKLHVFPYYVTKNAKTEAAWLSG